MIHIDYNSVPMKPPARVAFARSCFAKAIKELLAQRQIAHRNRVATWLDGTFWTAVMWLRVEEHESAKAANRARAHERLSILAAPSHAELCAIMRLHYDDYTVVIAPEETSLG